MEGAIAIKQDYDELEMLLGEIPNVTSANPVAEADAKLPTFEEQEGKSSASSPFASIIHSPRVPRQGCDVAYSILSFADNPFDQELQSSGKIDNDVNNYRLTSLDDPHLPDDRSLTSALENLGTDDRIARGLTMPSSVKLSKESGAHGLKFDGQYHSPVKKCFSRLPSVDKSVSQTTPSLDGLTLSTPKFEEYSPLRTNVMDKLSFKLNNHVDKPPKFNVHELIRQKSESLSSVLRDQCHNPGSMYSGGISFVPERNTFQIISGVSFSGAEFPPSAFQQQCYLEAQPPSYMPPPQHFSHPHIAWQKFEEDRYRRMHQQCFYVQQCQTQEVNPFQNGDNVSLGSLSHGPIKSNFELPIHPIEQADQAHYWSRSVLHRGVNQLGLTLMGSGSCRYYPQGFCGEENCTYGHAQKQTIGSSVRYSSKDLKGTHGMNKLGKQVFPKKILTRSQGPDSLRTLSSSPPTSNQSSILAVSEGRMLPDDQSQPPFQMSESFQVDGQDCEGSFDNSVDWLTSRPPKLNYKSLNEVLGKIYAMAKDPHGCRFLQEMFAEGTPEDVHKVFVEIIDRIVELMTDPYGNYLVQKLLGVCNEDQRMCIIHAITSKDGELIRISCDMHGTRAIQRVIETLRTPEQISVIVSSLKPGILTLIKDNNGNHVAQRCLQCLSTDFSKFLFDAVIAHCVELARDRRGCCVLQKCLSHCSGQQREQLISEISCNALILSQDQFGNYVVQYLLELKDASGTEDVLDKLEGSFGYLSVQKYSSNVVEKCLECAREGRRNRIISELINNPLLLQILQDPYGSRDSRGGEQERWRRRMALTNFILTVAGVAAVVVLFRGDVKQSAAIFRRNVRQIKHWLEEESSAASKAAEKAKPKELESQIPKKETAKEEK